MKISTKEMMHTHDNLFDAGNLRDVSHPLCSVLEARNLNDNSDCRSHLLAHSFFWKIKIGHNRHRFHSGEGIARAVGVNGGEGTIMTCVHGLEHVQRFLTTDLAHDDAIGTHTQAVDHQLPLHDGALTFHVGGATL